ncbi:hypothetical protein JCM3774_006290 [Rhodotorula dairenensis]
MLKRISNSFTKDSIRSHDLPPLLLPPPPPLPGAHASGSVSPRSSPLTLGSPSRFANSGSYPFPTPLMPRQRTPSPARLTPRPSGFTAVPLSSAPPSATGERSLERPVLHRTLTNLSALLVALDELRDTTQAQTRARNRVARASRDLATGFSVKGAGPGGTCREIEDALTSCAEMMETLHEVEERHAKSLRKEYEGLNEAVARYFRRTAKEEKVHEHQLATLDEQVAKATASYHSNARSTSATSQHSLHSALDSMTSQHSAYMETLSALSAEINEVKAQYGRDLASRHQVAGSEFAHALCALAEREWRKHVEGVRKGADRIGNVVSAAAWVQPGMDKATARYPTDSAVPETFYGPNGPITGALRGEQDPSRLVMDGAFEPSVVSSGSLAGNPDYRPSTISSGLASSTSAEHLTRTPLLRDSRLTHSPRTSVAAESEAGGKNFSRGEGSSSSTHPHTTSRAAGLEEAVETRSQISSIRCSTEASPSPSTAAHSQAAFERFELATPFRSLPPAPPSRSSLPRQASFPSREDSLVTKLSRKYSEGDREPNSGMRPSEPPPEVRQTFTSSAPCPTSEEKLTTYATHCQIAGPSSHTRSDSRVSQLVKRYSAPLTAPSVPLPQTPASPRYRAYQAAQPLPPASRSSVDLVP